MMRATLVAVAMSLSPLIPTSRIECQSSKPDDLLIGTWASESLFGPALANGNGGQLLIVVPELELVVVFTAGNFGAGGVWTRFRDDLVPNAIIAALKGTA